MTGTLTHPRTTLRPFLIVIAAFLAAVVVALVLAISAWTSGSGGGTELNPSPPVTGGMCTRSGPC